VPRAEPLADHIVFVMDESVSGDLLGINGAPWDTTPYLDSISDRILNYGVVPSISNLSSTTGIVLQSGLRPDQVPDRDLRSLKDATVFAYMQRAGFRAFYVDVQTYDEPSNFLTRFDVEQMDGFFQIIPLEVGVALHERDHRAIDTVDRLQRESERSFVYLLKSGAHIHYEGVYPSERRFFSPTLSEGELEAMHFEGADRTRLFFSYLNALRWTVDDFCRELFARAEASGREVLVIYTSDHGQSLLEPSDATGVPEPLSHNTRRDPPVFQAMVPLFLAPFGERTRARVRPLYDARLANRVGQFELFSTLLVAAGYDAGEVRATHGPAIFDAGVERGERFFVSGDHFGRESFQLNPYRARARPAPETAQAPQTER
jgi:glucan phosphoethanolaminetransferase (alkaline phosphatase superfamily)